MKCPHCAAEISESMMTCPYCGQTTATGTPQQTYTTAYSAPQTAQTNAQNAQNTQNTQNAPTYGYQQTAPYAYATPNYATVNGNASVKKGRSGGEIAAMITAIVVSIISVIASFVILAFYTSKWSENSEHYDFNEDDTGSYLGDYDFGDFGGYGIDAFDDEDSLENFFDSYSSIFGAQSQYPSSAPAAEHTPIEVQDYLYSFSDGYITTTYQVELDEAYRGEAALKLLDGAKLPELSDNKEIYLAKFKVTITEQSTEAYVAVAPSYYTVAYNNDKEITTTNQYTTLTYFEYKDNNQLLKKGESGERWMAFIVDKDDERPLIVWDKYNDGNYLRYSKAAVSGAAGLEAGAAIEEQSSVSSNS